MASAPPPLPQGFVIERQPARPSMPAVIEGPPREPPPQTPVQSATDEANLRRINLENANREREAAAGPPGQATESERTAAFLATRVAGGVRDLQSILSQNPDAASPEVAGTIAGVFGQTARNFANSSARQQVEAAQVDILDAALTLGTGAAYTREQLDSYRQSYFPQLGDTPETIAGKQQRLLRLLESARVKAGRSAPEIDRALGQLTGATGTVDDIRAAIAAARQRPSGRPDSGPGDPNANIEVFFGTPEEQAKQAQAGQDRWTEQRQAEAFRSPESNAAQLDAIQGIPVIGPLSALGRGIFGDENAAAAVRGGLDTALLGTADEIGGAARTVAGGTLADNIAIERGIDRYDQENNFGARLTGQLAGGLVLPAGAGAGVARSSAIGAGAGGAYGFGSGEGSLEDRGANALVGAGIGGAVGAGAGAFGNYLTGRAAARASANELLQAAERQGIEVLPADVGGPIIRRLTGGAAQLPFASGPITRAANAANEAAGSARDRAASTIGAVLEPEAAGEAARRGARSFIARTGGGANALYRRAERAAGETRVPLERSREVLDRNIAELSETPGGAEGLAVLRNLREEIDGDVTVAGARRMRTALRDQFSSSGLRNSDIERRVNQVVDAAQEDVVNGLRAAGRGEAARAYATADRYWRNRLRTIDDVLQPILGDNRSGEEIVAAIQRSARGNTRRLEQFIRALPEEESGIVRATLISQLGRPSASTDVGTAFSLNHFLTHYNQIQPRARRVLFGDAAPALDDLAAVARGTRQAQRYSNTSNTGGAGNVASILGGIGSAGTSIPLEMISGRVLASPAFARWLARAPTTRNPRLHIQGLATIAARNPAIAQEVTGLQRALMQAANDNLPNAGRAAASPNEGPRDANQ